MNNKFKGLAAVAAGTALLATGGTFALWSQTSNVAGANITSGVLQVDSANQGWYDVSNDRTDKAAITGWVGDSDTVKGHDITTTTWKASPGDTVLGLYTIDGALEGDNMVARLSVKSTGNPLNEVTNGNGTGGNVDTTGGNSATDGYTIRYALSDNAGNLLDPATGQALGTGGNAWVVSPADIKFSSTDNGHNIAALPTMDKTRGSVDYKLAIKVTFAADAANLQGAQQVLSNMTVGLDQERSAAAGNGGF